MISKKHKISHSEFMQYLRGKHHIFSAGQVIITQKYGKKPIKCAVIVPKKVYPKAHDRNTVKRFFYEIIAKNLDFLEKQNIHVVVLLKTPIKPEKQAITTEINALLMK